MAQATQEGLQPDGSLYHEYDRTARHYDKHREWGVSAEAMVGYLNAFQLSSKVEYLNNSIYAWKFAQKNLLDQEQGEWFWGVSDDYNIMDSEDKVGFWKCPYHHTRAFLEIINRCHLISR